MKKNLLKKIIEITAVTIAERDTNNACAFALYQPRKPEILKQKEK